MVADASTSGYKEVLKGAAVAIDRGSIELRSHFEIDVPYTRLQEIILPER